MNSILRLKIDTKQAIKEPLPEKYRLLGGRGLSSRIVSDEVPSDCDPLGKHNKLVITCGLLAGTGASSTDRVSVGTKSPITSGIKEANGGGITARNMVRHGLRAIIVEGQAQPDKPQVIVIDENEVTFEDAGDLWGKGTFSTMEVLFERFTKRDACMLIGPAGELKMNLAGIAHTDMEGRPTRYSARGGVGAVMGHMGIKAIIVKEVKGAKIPAGDDELRKNALKRYHAACKSSPVTGDILPKFGTSLTMEQMHGLGAATVHNYRCGQLEDINAFGGKKMREIILERGGEGRTSHSCMPGCIVQCSNIFADANGKTINSPMEYETLGLMGSNLLLLDFDHVNILNHLCNDIGIDTIETGAVLAAAAEEKLAEFGNFESMEKLLAEIAKGTMTGRLLGLGAEGFAKAFGNTRCLTSRGQAVPAYDPRTIKVNGVTYLTSPQGADHTAGNGLFLQIDHPDPVGKVHESFKCQVISGWVDSLGLCTFLRTAYVVDPLAVLDLLKSQYGGEWTQERLEEMGRETLRIEVLFNRNAKLPDVSKFQDLAKDEPLPPLNTVWEINADELNNIWQPLFEGEDK